MNRGYSEFLTAWKSTQHKKSTVFLQRSTNPTQQAPAERPKNWCVNPMEKDYILLFQVLTLGTTFLSSLFYRCILPRGTTRLFEQQLPTNFILFNLLINNVLVIPGAEIANAFEKGLKGGGWKGERVEGERVKGERVVPQACGRKVEGFAQNNAFNYFFNHLQPSSTIFNDFQR